MTSDVPTDLKRFRAWADRICGAWSSELQIMAANVADGKIPVEEFKAAHEREQSEIGS